jgi:O-antigen ligase
MAATSAGIIWHLRNQIAWPVWASWALTAIFLGATVFVFQGRTGYIVSGAVMSIAFYWMTPDRYRRVILLLAPIFVGTAMLSVSPPFQKRTANLVYEVTNYFQYLQGKEEIVWSGTSSGWRLNAWKVSIESIANSPVKGYGVGSWAMVARNTHGIGADQVFGKSNASNPHQEYLLWGVELGVLGLLLLPTIFLALIQDARPYPSPIKLAVTSTVFALAIACMFNSVLYDDLIGDYFCIVIGLLMAYGNKSLGDRENT